MLIGILSKEGSLVGSLSGGGNTQKTKTVIPADAEQIVTPDEGYDSLAQVIVEAIPSNYGHIAYNGSTIRVY